MITFGYECDTCELNHTAAFECLEDASWFLEAWKSQGMRVWRVK